MERIVLKVVVAVLVCAAPKWRLAELLASDGSGRVGEQAAHRFASTQHVGEIVF